MTIIICGATATGKSGFAVEIAKKIGGEIISADSMQIYKGMDIGTAKITEEECCGIKHHLIDIVTPEVAFSVSDYKSAATAAECEIKSRGKIPIFVGGTGLYINSIVYDYNFSDIAPDTKIRDKYYDFYEKNGTEALYELLKQKAPSAAENIHCNNIKRVIRALEVADSGGKAAEMKRRDDIIVVVLSADRALLYDRINTRVDKMFELGLEQEVKSLAANGYDFDLQSMQAIGYKEFKGYFAGDCELEQLKNTIKQNSRHYAKRQISWFKRYQPEKWFDIIAEQRQCENYILSNLE